MHWFRYILCPIHVGKQVPVTMEGKKTATQQTTHVLFPSFSVSMTF